MAGFPDKRKTGGCRNGHTGNRDACGRNFWGCAMWRKFMFSPADLPQTEGAAFGKTGNAGPEA